LPPAAVPTLFLLLFAPYYYASIVLSLICVCEAFPRLSSFSRAPNLAYSQ